MNRLLKKLICILLITVFLLSGLPSQIKSFAASVNLTVVPKGDSQYEISFVSSSEPGKTELTYHEPIINPDGTLAKNPDGTISSKLVTLTDQHSYNNGRVIFNLTLLSDHIYDIKVDSYRNAGDSTPSHEGFIYYLADISFTGESFNEMAKMADIEDKNPILEPNIEGSAVHIRSGDNPVIKFRWKIPTFFSSTNNSIEYLTTTDKVALNELAQASAPISKACFQINMTVGHGSTRQMDFNTDYSGQNMIIDLEGTDQDVIVDGITSGIVDSTDGYVSALLEKKHGIEAGTEYEFTNIGIIFKNDSSEQVSIRRTRLSTDSDNRFLVKNIDNAFSNVEYDLSSIFTPMQMEITKVDTDKVQVRFKKITNGVYPELFYQVQYAPRIDDLFSQTNRWVKIPASSLPSSEEYGSEIVTINLAGNAHPEYYFRVVYYDSSSEEPRSSSLCIDLRLLGVDTGKPPLPKEIKAEPIYVGRKGGITLPTTDLSSGEVEIPLSNLRLSFEKPLVWKMISDWNTYKATDYSDDDYIFHIILSAYLPDSEVESRVKSMISTPQAEVYLPVIQKRVLVIGKKDLYQDPEDSNRLICDIPGDKLFHDFVTGTDIPNENNEDTSEDGIKGDYPTFLIPNTTYYLQIFSSRYSDNDDIYADVWGDGGIEDEDLNNRLSFKSPVVSFTTWPLTEMPVPMPDIKLGIAPETYVDPVTGEMSLEGIRVSYNRVLTDVEWQRYTSATTGRVLLYEFFLSKNPSTGFRLVGRDEAVYPDEAEITQRSKTITNSGELQPGEPETYIPDEPILPNTVYYVKARTSLMVNGEVIGRSAETAVKAITTPKIDDGGLDNTIRDPRAPSEFSIAVNNEGELILSDASVTFNWLHAENDVTYEMICTTTEVSPGAEASEYEDDIYNQALLDAYSEFVKPPEDTELTLDLNDPNLVAIGLSLNKENGAVRLPISRFLRPNRTYFFSLRAVRRGVDSNGEAYERVSRWITIPVTTPLVKAPAFIEAVRDLEVGFNVYCSTPGTTSETIEVYLKKAEADDNSYVKLNRSQFSSVRDGNTIYIRVYNLESDQWYHIRLKNTVNGRWYNASSGAWVSEPSNPVERKTRDALKEIEVRWEGEEPYTYYLEARTDHDTDYEKLNYRSTGFSDYGYDLPSGQRIMFYREKTNLYVQEGSNKYIYYARIVGKPVRYEDGTTEDLPLKSNTYYYVKLWAFNVEESLHIGPAVCRTDFSQDDYDEGKKEDNVIDIFYDEADGLLEKLYWPIDKKAGTSFRVLLKDDKVSGLLRAARGSTITIDISGEQNDTSFYEVLIPQKTLETIEQTGSRLNLKLLGAEITLHRGSIDLEALKKQALVNSAKEAMLLLRIGRTSSSNTAYPSGLKALSKVYDIKFLTIGSRLTYAQISDIIFDILKEPDTSGPFSYGILDRELSKILRNLDSYSYRSHTDLKDLIRKVISNVEIELSGYLKDLIDGGRGYKADFIVSKGIYSFPGKIGIKLEYSFQTGIIAPYINTGTGWSLIDGSKAYVMQVVIFRAEKPGEYAVLGSQSASPIPSSPFDITLSKLSQYDLAKVFGSGTIYPSNPVTGQQALMLYAVITEKDDEIMGMAPNQRVTRLGLGDVFGPRQLTGYMDNQTSLSLAVRIYCSKTNINPSLMKPSRSIIIVNDQNISTNLYPYVLLGIDLNLMELENYRFDALGRTTTGAFLDMVAKALERVDRR